MRKGCIEFAPGLLAVCVVDDKVTAVNAVVEVMHKLAV
jgi:hypothetical protein